MNDQAKHQRIYWHSRRGMLELDLLLLPFVTEAFASLGQREQGLYEELLRREDQQLYAWLVSGSEAAEAKFASLIQKIRDHSTVRSENGNGNSNSNGNGSNNGRNEKPTP